MADDQGRQSGEEVAGLISHVELFSRDPQNSSRFYSEVFGWQCNEYEIAGKPYMGFTPPNGIVPGGFRKLEEGDNTGTVNYFKIFDIDATLKRIKERGGEIVLDKTLLPGIGWIARFRDPFGNLMGLFEPESKT